MSIAEPLAGDTDPQGRKSEHGGPDPLYIPGVAESSLDLSLPLPFPFGGALFGTCAFM